MFVGLQTSLFKTYDESTGQGHETWGASASEHELMNRCTGTPEKC
jgi:hypothetical protein